jgi:hypothetical protein
MAVGGSHILRNLHYFNCYCYCGTFTYSRRFTLPSWLWKVRLFWGMLVTLTVSVTFTVESSFVLGVFVNFTTVGRSLLVGDVR